jgi:hypothetical protein
VTRWREGEHQEPAPTGRDSLNQIQERDSIRRITSAVEIIERAAG